MATQILVPLDGFDLAEQALSCATMLTHGLAAELVLFRAVSLPSDVKDILAEVDLKLDVSVIDYAEANQIDLIGMCTHGRTGRMHWTLGSVADRVLRAGHIPILLVRAQ